MTLTSANRVHILSLIKIDNIAKSSDNIEFKILHRIKTSVSGTFQPLLIFPYFKTEPELCLASTIEVYLKKTSLRNKEKTLILTHKKPVMQTLHRQ